MVKHISTLRHSSVMMMIWIFILAGAFASSAKGMGGVQAMVDLCLTALPAWLLLAGLFVSACFVSLSVGTSVGTIVALVPIASGIAKETGGSLPLIVGAVVGGAFFGDNLSFISDTTIAATKTMGCRMKDKFKTNISIVLPAAVVVMIVYCVMGWKMQMNVECGTIKPLLLVPYLLVLATAIMGINVLIVLMLGIVATGVIGISTGIYSMGNWLYAMGEGIMSMGQLIAVTLLAAVVVWIIRHYGGIDFIMKHLTKRIHSKRGAELAIASMTIVTDFCTANNTIAILTVGPLAKEIAECFNIEARRVASLMDTFSCFAQSIIPYGAQLLMAGGLAMINPVEIIPYLYYPSVMFLFAFAGICRRK